MSTSLKSKFSLTLGQLVLVKQIAFLTLRAQQLIPASHDYYQECLREVSVLFQVPEDKLEFIIDAVSGNPLEVFKVKDKDLPYNVRTDAPDIFNQEEIADTFDP